MGDEGRKMKKQLRAFAAGFLYIFCNYFINAVPCWTVRKLLYRLCGMKIGKHSRIMMKTIVTLPWRISIGENTTINEYCYLDGRGGLTIGSNVNISLYSMLVTGTHDHRTAGFAFYTEPIVIEDGVWLAVRTTVLNGSELKKACIISAGSIVMPHTVCEEKGIYCGIPAVLVSYRQLDGEPDPDIWRVHFR